MFAKPIASLSIIFVLMGCVASGTGVEVLSQPTPLSTSLRLETEETLSRGLFDPEAARFRDWRAYRLENGDISICGEYNGLNRYGAYVGYDLFYVRWRQGAGDNELKSIKFGIEARYPCDDLATGRPLLIGAD